MATPKIVARPGSVQVGPHLYEVVWLTETEWVTQNLMEDAEGLTYHAQSRIYVRLFPDAPESTYQMIVWHEVQHAIWFVVGIANDDTWEAIEAKDVEETAIRNTASLAVAVMHANPDLVKYLTSPGEVRR